MFFAYRARVSRIEGRSLASTALRETKPVFDKGVISRALTQHSITHYALHTFTLSIVIFDSCISYTNMEDFEQYLPKLF